MSWHFMKQSIVLKPCFGINLGVKWHDVSLDMIYDGTVHLAMNGAYGVGFVSGKWHVNVMTHLFAGWYMWYKRLWLW